MKICRKIAELVTLFDVDDSLENIPEFLSGIGEDNPGMSFDCEIFFRTAPQNSITLSENHAILTISGPNLNNIRNPYNYIGFLQAITRFIALNGFERGIFLMHGSATVFEGDAIVFGDNGKSTAKTLSSLEVAIDSKKYIVDEFCFYDVQKNEVFSIGKIPIHLRDVVHENFKRRGIFTDLNNKYFEDSSAGTFFFGSDNFQNVPRGKVKSMFFTHFNDGKPKKVLLTGEKKLEAISFCVTAQIAKLIYPQLDRMSFANKYDTAESKDYNKKTMESVLKMLGGDNNIKKISKKIQCFNIFIQEPKQILPLIKD